jgi:AcrR family transcriptional regulator
MEIWVSRSPNKTDRIIKKALLDLLAEKPFAKVSVKEIVERSEVGRSTFYTHFENTESILESIEHDLLLVLTLYRKKANSNDKMDNPFESMRNWFDLCIQHKFPLLALTSHNGDPYFEKRLRNKVRRELADMMDDEKMPTDLLRPYFVESLASAFIGLMLYAINLPDDERLSSQELAMVINHARMGHFKCHNTTHTISDEQLLGNHALKETN